MNKELQRLSDFFKSNKDYFFAIYYGYNNSIKDVLFEPLSEKNCGEKKFTESVEKLENFNPDYIVVKSYKKAAKNFKKKEEWSEKIVLNRVQNNFEGLAGMEPYGGLGAFIESKTNLSILKAQNSLFENENKQVKDDNSNLKRDLENKNSQIIELNEKIRNLNWQVQDLERKNKNDIEQINKKNDNLDRFLTIGGTIVANVAGIKPETIKGLLGFDEKENENKKEENNQPDKKINTAIFKKIENDDKDLSEEKKKAKTIAESINEALNKMINANDDNNAFILMSKIGEIFNKAMESVEELNMIYDLLKK